MVTAKVWVLKKHFEGFPKTSDFDLKKIELPNLKDGGKCKLLLESVFLSVDPYMRPYSRRDMKEGDIMIGTQVARIVESKNPAFTVGAFVVARSGWRTHFISDGKDLQLLPSSWPESLPKSLALGTVGMPGGPLLCSRQSCCVLESVFTTAVSQSSSTFLLSFSVVCMGNQDLVSPVDMEGFQNDCNIVCDAELLRFHFYIRQVACFSRQLLDELSSLSWFNLSWQLMKLILRVVCWFFSLAGPYVQVPMIFKELRMEGFIVTRWNDRREEGLKALLKWVLEGKVKCHEQVTEGFENMPMAFIGMLKGENLGKAIVKV
ncbi:Prostaglandin reductase 1, partial [Megadyptes antipodes antipodes]